MVNSFVERNTGALSHRVPHHLAQVELRVIIITTVDMNLTSRMIMFEKAYVSCLAIRLHALAGAPLGMLSIFIYNSRLLFKFRVNKFVCR